jgi:formimidoylglutamate deiminase
VAANLWTGAAQGGAQALGQPVGRIAEGHRADLVVLDGGVADFEGLDGAAMLGVAMFSGNRAPVRDVFVGGRPRIVEGRHAEEHEARESFRRALRRLRAP